MGTHDMGARSKAGNKYLLVVVDRASKFMFASPPPNKTAENVAKSFLSLKKNQNAPRPSEHPPVMGEKCQNV